MTARTARNESGSGLEAEELGERADVGDRDAEGGAAEGGDEQGPAGAALEEGHAAGADHEDDERLRGERLDEPAGLEQGRAGVEDAQHDGEGEEVVERSRSARRRP